MAAVTALTGGDLKIAFWFVVAAAVCDFLDGFTARLLHSYSGIGVELDSLADVVSFGFAPAAILYALSQISECHWSSCDAITPVAHGALFLLTAFSALRLAKFNVDTTQHEEFVGLPTPASALFCAALGWLSAHGNLEMGREAIWCTALLLALLLIAPLRMFSFKFTHFGWQGNALRYLFLLVAIGLIAWARVGAVPLIILLYIIVSAIRSLLKKGAKR